MSALARLPLLDTQGPLPPAAQHSGHGAERNQARGTILSFYCNTKADASSSGRAAKTRAAFRSLFFAILSFSFSCYLLSRAIGLKHSTPSLLMPRRYCTLKGDDGEERTEHERRRKLFSFLALNVHVLLITKATHLHTQTHTHTRTHTQCAI